RLYMGKDWRDWPALGKGSAGLLAGPIGGILGQAVFLIGKGLAWDIVGRLLGWSLLGGLIGVGMALIVPNLIWWRGLAGGVVGGILGALYSLLVSFIVLDLLVRGCGSYILGVSLH